MDWQLAAPTLLELILCILIVILIAAMGVLLVTCVSVLVLATGAGGAAAMSESGNLLVEALGSSTAATVVNYIGLAGLVASFFSIIYAYSRQIFALSRAGYLRQAVAAAFPGARMVHGEPSLGVVQGDRVVIYLPVIPETVIITLACARIGAVHSLVFGGFSAEALRFRVEDTGAKVLVTTDGQNRRGKQLPLKPAVDQALADRGNGPQATVEHVLVVRVPSTLARDRILNRYLPIVTEAMAEAVAEGARSAGADVDIRRVPETVPEDVARSSGYKMDQRAPIATVDELKDYDAIIASARPSPASEPKGTACSPSKRSASSIRSRWKAAAPRRRSVP